MIGVCCYIFPYFPRVKMDQGESKEQGEPRDQETVGMVMIALVNEIPSPNASELIKFFQSLCVNSCLTVKKKKVFKIKYKTNADLQILDSDCWDTMLMIVLFSMSAVANYQEEGNRKF